MTNVLTTRIKKSFSISRESEQYIRKVRAHRKIGSDSEALDQILRESILEQSRASIDQAYTAYYDAASEEELAEESAWATYAEAEAAKLIVLPEASR